MGFRTSRLHLSDSEPVIAQSTGTAHAVVKMNLPVREYGEVRQTERRKIARARQPLLGKPATRAANRREYRLCIVSQVFTIEMDREKIRQAPSIPSFIEVFRTYYEVGVIVNKVADFLRQRGFNAHAGPAVGGDVNYIPVAIDAGLGISGKNGLLITRHSGPRVRLATVYTDIENLPFAQENSHGWVRDYCETCNICVQKCPADAIYPVTKILTDGGPAFIDHTKCAMPFSNDNGCTLCIKHCPFSSVSYDKLRTRFETIH